LIGLGGAEFRLPLLIGPFGFAALEAVILNKAMSLVVITSALPFRAGTVPVEAVRAQSNVIVNLLAGSLVGAWFGASYAIRLRTALLYRVIAVLLFAMAFVLMTLHNPHTPTPASLSGITLVIAGTIAGFVIGVVASLLGVAGGELLIPTLTILFGADLKLAGSVSLVVSLPMMLMGFERYSTDQSFSGLRSQRHFVVRRLPVRCWVRSWGGSSSAMCLPRCCFRCLPPSSLSQPSSFGNIPNHSGVRRGPSSALQLVWTRVSAHHYVDGLRSLNRASKRLQQGALWLRRIPRIAHSGQ
jgi:uncharacterized protein